MISEFHRIENDVNQRFISLKNNYELRQVNLQEISNTKSISENYFYL